MKYLQTIAREKWNGLLLLAAAAWLWRYCGSFPELEEGHPGPALFPRVMSVGLGIAGLLFLLLPWPAPGQTAIGEAKPDTSWLRLVGGVGVLALFPLAAPYLGFMATLGLVCFSFGLLFRLKPWSAALAALGTVLFVYLTFTKLLSVPL
jgi:putative tricarboxylic transport membrane protein